MSLTRDLRFDRKHVVASASDTLPYRFGEIDDMLLDTTHVLPRSFVGATVTYPSPFLQESDDIDVAIRSVIEKDVIAHVDTVDRSSEQLAVRISLDDPRFAVAALEIIAGSDRQKPNIQTHAKGTLIIHEYHAPVPKLLVKVAAKQAISSFIATTRDNLANYHYR